MERQSTSEKFPFGSSIPAFKLPAVDGKTVDSSEYFKGAKASMVVFTCNHCPYVKGSDQQLLQIIGRYLNDGLKVVAISSNDAAQYPDDSFEKMKLKSDELKFTFPYLYDESQEVARKFDAACTPEIYLFDAQQKLVYHGTVNDSPRDPSKVTKEYLSSAITRVLEGQKPDQQYVHPVGCSIKWKA